MQWTAPTKNSANGHCWLKAAVLTCPNKLPLSTQKQTCHFPRQFLHLGAAIDFSNDAFRHPRIYPTDTAVAQRKIARCEGVGLDDTEDSAVNNRAQRFHEIIDERLLSLVAGVQYPDGQIEARADEVHTDIVFEHAMSVIEHGVDGMMGVPVPVAYAGVSAGVSHAELQYCRP